MKKAYVIIPLVLLFSFFFFSCEKELSIENGNGSINGGGSSGGTAHYSLNGEPASCSGAVLTGTYTAGTAVTTVNRVVLSVMVDSIGSYTVSTGVVNGVSFSGSGNFITTGTQIIILTASGTPIVAGTFNYSTGAAGCTFSITALSADSNNSTDYIRCTIDGVNKTFNDGALAVNFFGTVILNGSENASAANTGNITIALSNSNIDSMLSFTPGVFLNVPPVPGKACLIRYIPDVSSTDTTGYGSASAGQPGAFTVTVSSITSNRIQGTFSGTLYDNGGNGANIKVVTNGAFSVPQ